MNERALLTRLLHFPYNSFAVPQFANLFEDGGPKLPSLITTSLAMVLSAKVSLAGRWELLLGEVDSRPDKIILDDGGMGYSSLILVGL